MGHLRVRHNAKARQSTKGGAKKKGKGKREPGEGDGDGEQEQSDGQVDANAEILIPVAKEDKEAARRKRLQQELAARSDPKMNPKKRRRLESYISKKLAKEERVHILRKLEKQQAQLPEALSLGLVTSASLGSGRMTSVRERREWEEDRGVRRALGGAGSGGRRRRVGDVLGDEGEDDEDADLDELEEDALRVETLDDAMDQVDDPPWTGFGEVDADDIIPAAPAAPPTEAQIGGALARRADGTAVVPVIVPRQARARKAPMRVRRKAEEDEEEEGSSFDSSDSAWDESSDGASDDATSVGEEQPSDVASEDEDAPRIDIISGTEPEKVLGKRKRASLAGFKQWANTQLDIAKGFVGPGEGEATNVPVRVSEHDSPAAEPTFPPLPLLSAATPVDPRPRPSLPSGPLGAHLPLPSTPFALALRALPPNPSNRVLVHRPPAAAADRLLLPIVAEEQQILEAVLLNPVVVICGETGSGKTTQVPGMLYEAGFGSRGSDNPGMIGITQPRRVAAMSTAQRVSYELALPAPGVAYAVRYDHTTSPETKVKFMTDGVLLRELASDFLLERYSVVIVDEAHERTLGTDVLVGVLSRVVKLRERRFIGGVGKPLRLIIMSATLRISDFTANTVLFPTPPPLIHIPARQHPVTIHFSRRTSPDYVAEAVRKVERIHTCLPGGGVLVFLTGQREIELVCKRLEARWGRKEVGRRKAMAAKAVGRGAGAVNGRGRESDWNAETPLAVNARVGDVEAEEVELGEREDAVAAAEEDDIAEQVNSDDEYMAEEENGRPSELDSFDVPIHILPLYSLLPGDKQMRVFQDPPADARLVVVATNVAETSLTIPGIRYVVDSGRAKERRYDLSSGIQSFQVTWESKASAAQRAGRSGRTGPGHCYRLYSSAVYENHFDQFAQPEILRMPIEGVVLQMKSMNIDAVVNFPFPTPPDRTALRKAETLLVHLGALDPPSLANKDGALSGRITELGKAMSLFPVSPRFAKMLVAGKQHGCLPYVIAIVAALSAGDPFLREEALGKQLEDDDTEEKDDDMSGELSHINSEELRAKEESKRRRKAFFQSQQTYAALGNGTSDIFRILAAVGAYEYEGGSPEFCARHFVRHKAMEEIHKLRAQITAIVRANFGDIIGPFESRVDPPNDIQLKALRQLLTAGFVDQVAVRKDIAVPSSATGAKYANCRGVPYRAVGIDEDVFIHPSSVLFHGPPPEYVVFLEVVRTSRVYVKTITMINPAWLSTLGRSLCTFSKPMQVPSSVTKKAAPATADRREVHVIPRFGPAAWELPPVLMTQKREGTRWVYVQ